MQWLTPRGGPRRSAVVGVLESVQKGRRAGFFTRTCGPVTTRQGAGQEHVVVSRRHLHARRSVPRADRPLVSVASGAGA
jgi:hypothetical protein